MNHIWMGLWFGLAYTCILLVAMSYSDILSEDVFPDDQLQYKKDMTWVRHEQMKLALRLCCLLGSKFTRHVLAVFQTNTIV